MLDHLQTTQPKLTSSYLRSHDTAQRESATRLLPHVKICSSETSLFPRSCALQPRYLHLPCLYDQLSLLRNINLGPQRGATHIPGMSSKHTMMVGRQPKSTNKLLIENKIYQLVIMQHRHTTITRNRLMPIFVYIQQIANQTHIALDIHLQ